MRYFLLVLLVAVGFGASGQTEKFTVSGNIRDASNGEDINGANNTVNDQPGVGTITNVYGFYSLTLPKGNYTLVYSFIGFAPQEFPTDLTANVRRDVELGNSAEQLKEFVVTGEKEDENVTSTEMSVSKIDIKDIENIPVLFGEKDVIKTIQLLPGVKSAGEGSTGFYVRGGAADQNLILLDEAPVYNASHLLGFFSVFNSDALKDVKLYKGAIPAQFGGRLSSVMDIKMKEGNSKQLGVSGGVGLISSRLTVEAPIVKDKGSFIVSGRRTYADAFLKLSSDPDQQNTILYFYDLNAKANYRLGDNDRLFLSGYFGRDNFGFSDQFGFDWGNATGTLRWNHIYNQKLFSNTAFIYSNYNYDISFGGDEGATIGSVIQDLNLKHDFDYYASEKHKLKFGGNVIHHTFEPGAIDGGDNSGINDQAIESRYSLESAAYFQDEWKVNGRWSLNWGVRYSNFTQVGPGDIFTYDVDGNVTDTTTYDSFETVASYNGLAPRVAATFLLNEFSSLKGSVGRTYQYLHLLSNSNASSPTDVWMPSSNNIKPQISDQVALGYFHNFNKNTYEFSAETYYKTMQNVIDYRTGASVTLNAEAEGELLFGDGRAYGLELFLKKKKGKFTGWVSYTLARSEKQFDEINDNTWYPARQDRTHDISIVAMYSPVERLNLSATWVYYTGNAVTFPNAKYLVDGQLINLYSERNGYRMPDYHRLDLGLTWHAKKFKLVPNESTGEVEKVKRKFESSWNLSVYNAYSRENAYSISFRESEDGSGTEAVQLSLFKVIPSISYNFKF